ncbi:MAG: excinuclease ABC subunit UvrC [Saccharofermentanales bacterium]
MQSRISFHTPLYEMNSSTFDARLDLVPENPGVYLMKDTTGSVIYVGKAVNLRSRLRSYFNPNPKGSPKVLAMIAKVADFSIILCSNETEALLLECNLIKQYFPRYNIRLMDDKEYPYIKITMNEAYPRVVRAFHIGADVKQGARYYGPYLNGVLRTALETLKELFPVRSCNLKLPEDIGRQRPCLNYHIGKCPAPCNGYISQADYMDQVNGIRLFLEGRYDGITGQISARMNEAAARLDFEKAALYRDRLAALKQLMAKQTVSSLGSRDLDAVGIAFNQAEICVQKLEVRQGRMVGNATFFSVYEDGTHPEILQNMLLQHYSEIAYIPSEILIPVELPDIAAFSEAVSTLRGSAVKVRMTARGIGRELVSIADKNARQALRRRTLMAGSTSFAAKESLGRLSEMLFGDRDRLRRVEAYDISNYGNEDIAASMVVFENGKPLRSGYRLFKIRKQEIQDDYAAMRQALERRFARAGDEGFGPMPQLVLVDGGAGHVSMALDVIGRLEVRDVAVLGMVKDNKHRTRALLFPDGGAIELAGNEETPGLEYEDRRSLLRLVSAVQDEAHRFAGKYSGKLSNKRQIRFSLESISGVGPSRRKALLRHFGTLRALQNATLDEILKTEGISRVVAEAVHAHFHGGADTDEPKEPTE